MRKITLTKIKDTRFSGNHPNGINKGYIKTGNMINEPKVGERFVVDSLRTSTVTRIIDETTFETLNSIYKITYHESIEPYIPS